MFPFRSFSTIGVVPVRLGDIFDARVSTRLFLLVNYIRTSRAATEHGRTVRNVFPRRRFVDTGVRACVRA